VGLLHRPRRRRTRRYLRRTTHPAAVVLAATLGWAADQPAAEAPTRRPSSVHAELRAVTRIE
jgi:hypothetical protein